MEPGDSQPSPAEPAARRFAAAGGKGFAARGLQGAQGGGEPAAAPLSEAALRPAMARVGAKRPRSAAGPTPGRAGKAKGKARSKAEAGASRAEQAALGVLAGQLRPGEPFDEAHLQDCLQRLGPAELGRLRQMLATVEAGGRGQRWSNVAEAASARAVIVEVHGDHNTVTVTQPVKDEGRDRKPWQNRSNGQQAWGRAVGRVRNFLDGR